MYPIDAGSIRINGIEISDIDTLCLRSKIGKCLQRNCLYPVTIREYLDPSSDEQLMRACKISGFDKVMETHDLSFDSILTTDFDETGAVLSGGELQKLFVTRALSKKVSLYIFDEPTNSMDDISAERFYRSVTQIEYHPTIILISHDESAKKYFHKVINLVNNTNHKSDIDGNEYCFRI